MKRHIFDVSQLQAFTKNLFVAADTPRHIADDVAEILIKANLAGHDSHGVLRIPSYLEGIDNGGIRPAAEPTILRETETHFILTAGVASDIMQRAMRSRRAIEKAKSSRTCFATSRIPTTSADSVNTHRKPLNRGVSG